MSHDSKSTENEAASAGEGGTGQEGSSDGAAWAWATEHRPPESASTAQLVSWFARGELPPHTLVWKPGWGEWLPALQVAEFAEAFPSVTVGSRRRARALLEGEVTPPPVPVAEYPRLRLLAKDVLGEGDVEVTPFTALPQHLAPAQVGRRALRDPDHAQHDLVTSQVPAAAMLEAARAMKRAPSKDRRGHFGSFGDAASPGSSSPPQRLSPPALGSDVPAAFEAEPSGRPVRASSGYGSWLLGGALVGAALGLLSIRAAAPQAAAPTYSAPLTPALPPAPERTPPAIDAAPPAPAVAEETPRVAPPSAKKPAGVVQVKRAGAPAVLHALRSVEKDAFDRVVFEFRERMPGYHIAYVEKPVRDCGSGDARRIDGNARLEVRFSPAAAHTERAEPTVRERELRPGLSMVREIERTCDHEGIVTWVIGTASPHHYRAFELSAPPRLVVDIDH